MGAADREGDEPFEVFASMPILPQAVSAINAKTTKMEREMVCFFMFISLSHSYEPVIHGHTPCIISPMLQLDFTGKLSEPYEYLKA